MRFLFLSIFLLFFSIKSQNLQLSLHGHGTVEANSIQQFYLPAVILSNTNYLSITTAPLSGDCELHVSNLINATRQNSIWKSTHTGPNLIFINKTSPGYIEGAPYFISVFGVWRTNFKIIAYISDGAEIRIDNEEPQVAEVDKNTFLYFRYRLSSNESFAFGLTPVAGDPDIYVDTIPNPTRTRNKWRSLSVGPDVLTIFKEDPNFVPVGSFYYIGIYGYSTSLFQLAATTFSGSEVLTEGLPHAKEVYTASQQYFQYQLSSFENILIEVRPRTLGNQPNLCVSATVERPNPNDNTCTWSSYGWSGFASLRINKEDPAYKNSTYYIGVSGWPADWRQTRIRFSVMASTRLRSRLLMDGVPEFVSLPNNTYSYFRIYFGWSDIERLQIDATIQTGYTELYVSNDPTNQHPTRQQNNFVSTFRSSMSTVSIPTGSPEGWYWIGALAFDNSNFTLRATTLQTPTELIKGSSTYFWGLPPNEYKYYAFDISREMPNLDLLGDMTIATHWYSGDGSIVIGTEPRPTTENAIWKSEWTHGITVTKAQLRQTNPTYLHIGVKGTAITRSFYSILLYFSNTPVQILAGSPIEGIVPYGQYRNFFYKNPQAGKLRVSLTVKNADGDADMFMDYYPNPNMEKHEWRSAYWGPKSIVLDSAMGNQDYYISVYGSAMSRNVTRFQLRINVDYETISDGNQPFADDVNIQQYRRYQIFIPSSAERYMVSTTLINGYTEMYMMQNESEPTRENYQIAEYEWPGNVIYLEKSDPNWRTGVWSVAVYGYENSDYFIGGHSEWGQLTLGQPQTGSASPDDMIHYWGEIDPNKNLFINIKNFDQVCLRVFVSQEDMKPNNSTAKWTARSSRRMLNQVSMWINEKTLNKDYYWVYISVRTCLNVPYFGRYQFEITMSNHDTPQYISQEVHTVYSDIESPKKPWFIVNSFSHSNGFNFILDSCTNDPAPSVFATTNDTLDFPITRRTSEYTSVSQNKFTSVISASGSQFQKKRILISLPENQLDQYSIFSNTRDYDTRPIIPSFVSHFLKRYTNNGKTYDSISLDVPRISSEYYPLFYEIVKLEHANANINFYTVCAIRNVANLSVVWSTIMMEPAAISHYIDLDISDTHVYAVVVTDWYYRQASSNPLFYSKSETVPPPAIIALSVGGFLLAILALIIIVYLILGMVVKKIVYKSSGIHLIPNIGFWMDCPLLFVDGIKFILTCGKRSSSGYTENIQETQTQVGEVEGEENPFGKTSYGAI